MSKTLKIYLLLFTALIVVMIAIDQSRDKPLDWSRTYNLDEKNPLDLYVLNQEIDHLFNGNIVRYDKNPFQYFYQQESQNIQQESYLFISEYVYLDEALTNRILNAVRQGSTLFVVSNGFTPYLIDTLQAACVYLPYDSPVTFTSDEGKKQLGVKLNTGNRAELKFRFSREEWGDEEYSCSPIFGQYGFIDADTTISTALGYMRFPDESEYIYFMEFRIGKGKIILHSQPVVFSNYSLLSDKSLQEYAERTLSYLPVDEPIVWFVANRERDTLLRNNQLSVLFRYPALRLAWLIFLYGLILFVFFTAKRKQRVVPLIKPLQNSTVEFAQTIGNLYFQEGDTSDIARKKIIYFLDRVRRRYNIETQLPEDKLAERLHLKSGKDRELIGDILSLIGKIESQNRCDKQQLVQLSVWMDQFWEFE